MSLKKPLNSKFGLTYFFLKATHYAKCIQFGFFGCCVLVYRNILKNFIRIFDQMLLDGMYLPKLQTSTEVDAKS